MFSFEYAHYKQKGLKMVIAIVVFVFFFPINSFAADGLPHLAAQDIQVLKIAPSDQRAVVKLRDGTMRIIRPGDLLYETARVTEIGDGRIVIEERTDEGVEIVMVYFQNGLQKVDRFRKTIEKRSVPYGSR